jgi:uncharacterized protein
MLLCIGLALALLAAGCRKEPQRLPAARIHGITRELAAAAATVVTSADVRSALSASDEDPESTDRLDITLHRESVNASDPAGVALLLQELGRVATRNRLTQDAQSESREGILFSYSRAGYVTHWVHIHVGGPARVGEDSGPSPAARGARLAIILDDLGTDRAAADAIFSMGYALTVSVLPNRPHSVDIAEEARRRGYQVMLHLPMQSLGNGRAESEELRPGMRAEDVSALVSQFLQAVPGVAGVNNHQGSQSTADAMLMSELMPVLRERNLFYIDSRTTAATVAYDAARKAGVRAGFRNVPFLDDVEEVGAVRKQLLVALRGAHEKGEAIAIGHPHRATLAALHEILPQAKAQGIQLVFASDLVH